MSRVAFDVVGDTHGQLGALQALGVELGYDPENGWSHPDGRVLVFIGDLVDRGAHSLEVGELVYDLYRRRRGLSIMGNHEYNLVAWWLRLPGFERPKKSNAPTTRDIVARPDRWTPVLEFFRGLPMAIEFEDLRVIHACWHRDFYSAVAPVLAPEPPATPVHGGDALGAIERAVALRSPFEGRALRSGLPTDSDGQDDAPHEILMKGYEVDSEPFRDNDGKRRDRLRARWWGDPEAPVPRDRSIVFGHYWNIPPVQGQFAPPEPSGHPALRQWARDHAPQVPATGRAKVTSPHVCVDYNGLNRVTDRAFIGALRWPEREVVWASAPKTTDADN